MDAAKRKRLEAAGWKVGSAAELLGLTEAEIKVVEVKLDLGGALEHRRASEDGTQLDAAISRGSS